MNGSYLCTKTLRHYTVCYWRRKIRDYDKDYYCVMLTKMPRKLAVATLAISVCWSWCACRTVIECVYISHIATKAKAIILEPNRTMSISLAVFINTSWCLLCCWWCRRIRRCLCRFLTAQCRYITTRTNVFSTFSVVRHFPLLIIVKVPSIMIANASVVEYSIITVIVSLNSSRNT